MYDSIYSDPRWLAKRKEILLRDNFKCTRCESRRDLKVHHIQYIGKIWETPNEFLTTLCDSCHRLTHQEEWLENVRRGTEDLTESKEEHAHLYRQVQEYLKSEQADDSSVV